MKKILFALCLWLGWAQAWAQTGDSTETFGPTSYQLRFQSFETEQVTGSFVLPLVIDVRQALDAVGYQSITDSKEYFQVDAAEIEQLGPVAANSRYTVGFTLTYDVDNRPFYPVQVSVVLAQAAAPGTPAQTYQRDCYVYFTPYNTVEVWDQTDYETLRRMWLTDDGLSSSARMALNRDDIPKSDIPADYRAADGEEFDMVFVPGLAYAVPMLYSDFQGYNDGTGNNPTPGGANNSLLGVNVFKGQISNQRIFTYHQPDGGGQVQLPLRRGRVEVWWDVRGGSDQHVKTFYTDNEGYLTENGSRTVQFSFSAFSFSGSPQSEQMYLRIKMQDQWNQNNVWSASISNFPLITSTPRQLLPYNANPAVYPALAFGQPTATDNAIELPETQGLKPFTWAMACRDQVWNALNGTSAPQLAHSLVILLTNNPADAYYRTSDRGIRLGPPARQRESTTMHEFGHFLMHDLSRASDLPGQGGAHSFLYNNDGPGMSVSEGFANGFSYIMDEMTYQELDRESGFSFDGNLAHHPRWTFGTSFNANLTHPFVSEGTMAAIMLDLWDGPNNLAAVGNPLPPGFYEDNGDAASGYIERYETSLYRILSPIFYKSPQSIAEYFAGLLGDNSTDAADNQRIREVWYYNFNAAIPAINTAAFKVLNMDEIDPAVTFTTPRFRPRFPGDAIGTSAGVLPGTTVAPLTVTYRNTDTGVLNGPNDSFNVTTYVQDQYDSSGRHISQETKNANGVTLTDPVLVTNGAELGLHSGAQPRWQNRTGGLTTYTKRTNHLEIALRAQARLTIGDGCQTLIGSVSPYQTTSVSLYDDTYIVVERGATLKIEAGSTLNIWEKGTLLVRNGGTLLADGSLMIRWGGHICIEAGGIVRLSPTSTLYVDGGAQMGVRPGVGLPTTLNCTNEVAGCGGTTTILNPGVVNVGSRNEALRFDGNDAIVIANTNSLVNTSLTQQFAVEAFLRADNLNVPNAQTIFSSRHFATNGYDGILFSLYGGQLLLQLDGRNYYSSANLLPNDNGCHHVAVTRDNANRLRFYIDGRETTYSPTTPINAHSDGNLNLGADMLTGSHSEFFGGLLGEVRVWNTWRSGDQIRQNLRSKLTPQTGLVAYYDMQDASNQQLSDLSGVPIPVPGTLGVDVNSNQDDPTWVTQCALACTVQGNFRTTPLDWTPPDSTNNRITKLSKTRPAATAKSLSQLTLSPNPATGEATMHFHLRDAGKLDISIQDMTGYTRTSALPSTTLEAGAHEVKLPLHTLRAGLYLVIVNSADGRDTIRLEVK